MKSFHRPLASPLLLLLLTLILWARLTVGHPDHVDHTDEEIDAMNTDFLVHVEHDLRSQNGVVDKHIASLRGKFANLKRQQDVLEKAEVKVAHARDWEARQKKARQKELERARAEIEAKKEQARMLLTETDKLKEEILELKDKIHALNLDRKELHNEYLRPSLDAILNHKIARMSLVPQQILNKTIKLIIPEVEYRLHEVHTVQEKIPRDSTMISVLTSFCIYVLAVFVLYTTWSCVTYINGLLTLTRTLFTVDMAFAFVWLLACFVYLILSADPFAVMAKRHGGLTVIIQMVLIGALLGNVILRCIPVSLHFKRIAIIELLCIIFVTQHYYQSVWRPCLLDEEVITTFGTYIMYFLISSSLAVYRARSFGRGMEEVQEKYKRGSLSIFQKGTWLRRTMERVLKYCEDLICGSSEQDDVCLAVEPQYYRKTRHPEFSRGKGRSFVGRSSLRHGKKPIEYTR